MEVESSMSKAVEVALITLEFLTAVNNSYMLVDLSFPARGKITFSLRTPVLCPRHMTVL